MAAATPTRAPPTRRPRHRGASAAASPADTTPAISRSTCSPPMPCTSVTGLGTASQTANAGSTPTRRASRGSDHDNRPTPASASTRSAITDQYQCMPVPCTTPPNSHSDRAGYTDVVPRHARPHANGLPVVPRPTSYGLWPLETIPEISFALPEPCRRSSRGRRTSPRRYSAPVAAPAAAPPTPRATRQATRPDARVPAGPAARRGPAAGCRWRRARRSRRCRPTTRSTPPTVGRSPAARWRGGAVHRRRAAGSRVAPARWRGVGASRRRGACSDAGVRRCADAVRPLGAVSGPPRASCGPGRR